MTEREKIAHVLRRLGLGAGRLELAKFEKLGWKGTVDALLNDHKVDEGFPISPYEFVVQPKGNLDPNAGRMADWWALRMTVTNRPFQEKLTLFWHNHFALDAEKVSEAPTMLGYLDVLRSKGRGKFRDLLHGVVKQGALLIYLDNTSSNRIHPNENFARELFELFTLGIGHYTEQDIKESARAFTGWSLHYLGTGLNLKYDQLRERATRNKLALYNFCVAPAVHDDGEKTILGKTGDLDGDDVLDLVASHPATIQFISKKLWSWYAYPDPEPAIVEKLGKVWKKTDGDITAIIKAMTAMPEFWSAKCVRQLPKSPVDYTVALLRALDPSEAVLKARGAPEEEFTALASDVRSSAQSVNFLMRRQGLALLYPPNVAGWNWGSAWITAQNVAYRLQHSGQLFAGGAKGSAISNRAATMIKQTGPRESTDLVRALAEILDVPLQPSTVEELAAVADKLGGIAALDKPDTTAKLLAGVTHVMFAVPDFQLC